MLGWQEAIICYLHRLLLANDGVLVGIAEVFEALVEIVASKLRVVAHDVLLLRLLLAMTVFGPRPRHVRTILHLVHHLPVLVDARIPNALNVQARHVQVANLASVEDLRLLGADSSCGPLLTRPVIRLLDCVVQVAL